MVQFFLVFYVSSASFRLSTFALLLFSEGVSSLVSLLDKRLPENPVWSTGWELLPPNRFLLPFHRNIFPNP